MSFWSNVLGPRRTFEGGCFLPDQKAATARRPIEMVAADGPLHIPLQAARGLATIAEIAVGEHVLGGQRLARPAEPDSLPVHAPTSGTITALTRVWAPLDGYLPGAVLEPDGKNQHLGPTPTWESESFVFQLARHGVMCGAPRRPAHRVIQDAVAAGVTELIVNAVETEPYLSADLRTLVEEPGRLIDTICDVADALGAHRAMIALPFRHRRVVKRIEAEATGRHIEVAPLSERYPQCQPTVLVKTLLDREVPVGESVLDVGVLVLPLATIRAAAGALLEGRPVIETVVTVAGDAVDHAGNYRVPIGTPMRRLAERAGLLKPVALAVVGGPLTGVAIGREEAVVTTDTTALLLFSAAEQPKPVPCIHCGWCIEDCPVGLDPSSLIHVEAERTCDEMTLAQLRVCVDCGLCSHVCPAQLPLSASIKRARLRLLRQAEEAVTAGS
ncbi:MAG TPA: RnfABCDGE type electron transport complex subunit C [Phycisphaerae bacterium]|nr:RnfABCDGE type electron transport complex subunit C [Phycisphaerae bacterium]